MLLWEGGCQGKAAPDSPLLLAGTHIIYVRKFLLECKNSPVARTLPCCLPQIPGVTSLARCSLVKPGELKEQNESEEAMPGERPRQHGPCFSRPRCLGRGALTWPPSSPLHVSFEAAPS